MSRASTNIYSSNKTTRNPRSRIFILIIASISVLIDRDTIVLRASTVTQRAYSIIFGAHNIINAARRAHRRAL